MNGTPEERQERLRVLRQKKKDRESDDLMNEMVRKQNKDTKVEEIIDENEQLVLDWKDRMREVVTRFTGEEKKEDEREPIKREKKKKEKKEEEREPIKRRKIIKEIVIADDNKEVVIVDNSTSAYVRIEFG